VKYPMTPHLCQVMADDLRLKAQGHRAKAKIYAELGNHKIRDERLAKAAKAEVFAAELSGL
jgi:hypothetical protein